MRPAWLRGALIFLLTFAAGAAAGIGYDRHISTGHRLRTPTMDTEHAVRHMQMVLGLDSAQTAAIETILAHHQRAVDSSWHAMQPQVSASLDSTLREIQAVMKPEQVGKFREMVHVMHPGMLP